MITGPDALSKSLQKYCYNGLFCIASGDGKTFTRNYLSEQVPFFDVTDQSLWLLDKSCKPEPKPIEPEDTGSGGVVQEPPFVPDQGDKKEPGTSVEKPDDTTKPTTRHLKEIVKRHECEKRLTFHVAWHTCKNMLYRSIKQMLDMQTMFCLLPGNLSALLKQNERNRVRN